MLSSSSALWRVLRPLHAMFATREPNAKQDSEENEEEEEARRGQGSRFRTILYWFYVCGASAVSEPTLFWFLPAAVRYRVAMRLTAFAQETLRLNRMSKEQRREYLESRAYQDSLMDALRTDDLSALERLCCAGCSVDYLTRRIWGAGSTALQCAVEEDAMRCVPILARFLAVRLPSREAQAHLASAFRYCTKPYQVGILVECGARPNASPHCADLVAQAGYPEVASELILHGARFPNIYCLEVLKSRPGHFEQVFTSMLQAREKQRTLVLLVLKRCSPACYQVDDLALLIFRLLDIVNPRAYLRV